MAQFLRSGPARFTMPKKAIVVADAIAEEILAQGLPPGTPVATEGQMLSQFQIGRATLREALRLLEAEGVISVRAGSKGGAVVQAPSLDRLARLLSIVFAVSGTTIGEVVVARRLFEPDVCRLAAENATDEEIEELGENVGRSRAALAAGGETIEIFRDFHSGVMTAGRNRALSAFWLASSSIITQQVGVGYHRAQPAAAQAAHEEILAAIKGRDKAAARDAMARHTDEVLGYLEGNHSGQLDHAVRFMGSPHAR